MVGLAQLAEHQIVVLRVVGSTPTTHPKKLKFFVDILKHLFIINPSVDIFRIFNIIFFINKDLKMCRGVAQLVAYSLWERGVVSSSLAAPTIKNLMTLSSDSVISYQTMYFGAANFKIHSLKKLKSTIARQCSFLLFKFI